MTTIKEKALEYEQSKTKNIADLPRVSVDMEVTTKICSAGTPEEFSMDVTTIDGEEYRVPVTVLRGLKAHVEENKNLKFFKVVKAGEGMKTNYTVVPME